MNNQGFKVYKDVIPSDLIDQLLYEHKKFKRSRLSVFRAQGTTKFEFPLLDKNNNQINSIQNPHLLGFHPKFRKQIEEIIFHSNVSKCLSDFSGQNIHTHFQSMLFDKSTGTKLHQDTWYLDTSPPGNLLGVWFALEDIDEESGPFCLYSNVEHKRFEQEDYDFEDIERDKRFTDQFPNFKRFDFMPKKGDLLVWNSFVIHGAHLPKNDSKTRKSLTSHFYPISYKVQQPPIKRSFSIYNHEKPKLTKNPLIKQSTIVNPIFYNSICLILNKLGAISSYLTNDQAADEKKAQIRRIN